MKFLIHDTIPVAYYDATHRPTKAERHLTFVDYETQHPQAILDHCYYDGTFRYHDTDLPFDDSHHDLPQVKVDGTENELYRDAHTKATGNVDLSALRREYYRRAITMLEHKGWDEVVAAIANGCYQAIHDAINNLPVESKTAFKNSPHFPPELIAMIENDWGIQL